MKSTRRYLIPGLILAAGLITIVKNAAASTNTELTLTIHVNNSARVEQSELIEAEKIAAGIFGKAGIEIRWTVASPLTENMQETPADKGPSDLSLIRLNILPQALREPSIRKTAMGLAPGTGRNRQWAYVFYDRIKTMARRQIQARLRGSFFRPATLDQILAHAIVHEVGHLLLNFEVHSANGIMRGDWNDKDLEDIAYGTFVFTPHEAEAMREDLARRLGDHQGPELAGLALPESAQ
jgi:hypothetical protein